MVWHVIRWALLALALGPLVYYIFAAVSALRFFRRPALENSGFAPPVSILKPVRGLDREARENYFGFFRQEYPRYEILFNVPDDSDPAIPVIEQLIR